MNTLLQIVSMLLLLLTMTACTSEYKWNGSLEDLMNSQPERFGTVMEHPEKYRVQILYTQIDRDEANRPTFTSFDYRLNEQEYFYPASTVKLPVALMALQKLNELDIPGLDKHTTMLTDSAYTGQSVVRTDSSAETGLPSVAQYIRKIFLVSDNDAYNRLWEFCGLDYLNEGLHQKGYDQTWIVRRFYSVADREVQRHSNPIRFVQGDELIHEQLMTYAKQDYLWPSPILLGKGELNGDTIVEGPKDFSTTNVFGLADMQGILKAALFPESVAESARFDLAESDYPFLYQYMSQLPRESTFPDYSDYEHYYDGYVKFFLFGDTKERIPANIRVFNKVGTAYGFLTDCAYIVDFENEIEFLLSAVIYTNENEIFNDDVYEYKGIGWPFISNLGKAIYEVELARERAHTPDLSRFRVQYDK